MSAQKVETNKVVTFTYIILDENGGVQEQSDLPMSYLHGQDGRMFPAVNKAMEGAKVGDTVEVTLTPEEGFGVYDPELTFSDKIENVPPKYRQIGAEATFQNDAGESITMTVVSMENGEIKLDGNHPFAGKTMTFKINIQAVRDAAEEEIRTGQIVGEGPNLANVH